MNGLVYQDYDNKLLTHELEFVTKAKPDEETLKNLLFAFKTCKCVASNGIVVVKDGAAIGIGQGEVRRSWLQKKHLKEQKANLKAQ